MRCAMVGCSSDNQSKNFDKIIMFFRFPSDKNLQKLWITACRRQGNFNVNTARLCSLHFDVESFERNLRHELLNYKPKNLRLLKPDAVPTLKLPKHSNNGKNICRHRHERATNRSRKQIVDEIPQISRTAADVGVIKQEVVDGASLASTSASTSNPQVTSTAVSISTREIGVNTEAAYDQTQEILELKKEIEKLKNENKVFQTIFTPDQIKKE